jgi:hypothetical protein
LTIDVTKLTDQECMDEFINLLNTRVVLGVSYIMDPSTSFITHHLLTIQVGDLQGSSEPEELPAPLTFPPISDTNITVN